MAKETASTSLNMKDLVQACYQELAQSEASNHAVSPPAAKDLSDLQSH